MPGTSGVTLGKKSLNLSGLLLPYLLKVEVWTRLSKSFPVLTFYEGNSGKTVLGTCPLREVEDTKLYQIQGVHVCVCTHVCVHVYVCVCVNEPQYHGFVQIVELGKGMLLVYRKFP